MASVPVKQTPAAEPAETIEQQFRRLKDAWRSAVAYLSSTTVRNNHPAYRDIIGLGPEVVPLLLRDMEDHHTHWFCALRAITQADPIPQAIAGDVPKMVQAWLQWAKENGYRW